MFKPTGFEKLLDKATSHLLMEPDWPSILQICDLIRQDDVQPRVVLNGIKKKLQTGNPHTALFALQLLESVVKNGGNAVYEELSTKAYCDMLHHAAKTTVHDNVKQKLLELIQTWNYAFRKNPKNSNLKDLLNTMKAEGFKFATLQETKWADGEVCHRCRGSAWYKENITAGLVGRCFVHSVLRNKQHCLNLVLKTRLEYVMLVTINIQSLRHQKHQPKKKHICQLNT